MRKWWIGSLLIPLALMAGNPDVKTICETMPSLEGWQARQCDGIEMGGVLMVSEIYTRGDEAVNFSIVTGARAAAMWRPFEQVAIDDEKALIKSEKIDGFDVGISYDKRRKSGSIAVRLTPNAILVLAFDEMPIDDAIALAKKADWRTMASRLR